MIVAFDLEGTLTTGATWRGVGEYLRQHGQAGRYGMFYAAHVPGALLVRAGLLAMQPYKERWLVDLARLLRGLDAAGLAALGEWVVEHEMWPQRRADALAALHAHLDAGDRVIIASGTYEPIARAFAARAGVGEVLSTPFDLQNGHATGRMAQRLGTGQTKLDSLRGLLNGAVLGAAYGDTARISPCWKRQGRRSPCIQTRCCGRTRRRTAGASWMEPERSHVPLDGRAITRYSMRRGWPLRGPHHVCGVSA